MAAHSAAAEGTPIGKAVINAAQPAMMRPASVNKVTMAVGETGRDAGIGDAMPCF